MNIQLTTAGPRVYITGNTYAIREQLRNLGCNWDGSRKAWWIGVAKSATLRALVEEAQATTPAPERKSTGPMVSITGNTYPVKDRLRALGGRWNGAAKCWEVPTDRAAEAREIVANAPKAAPRSYTPAGKCRGCRGPIRDASYCRASGGYCGFCAYDEF